MAELRKVWRSRVRHGLAGLVRRDAADPGSVWHSTVRQSGAGKVQHGYAQFSGTGAGQVRHGMAGTVWPSRLRF